MRLRLKSFLLCLTPLLAVVESSAFARSRDEPLRVMTFNIRLPVTGDGINAWDKRRDPVVEMLKAEAPDVIGTQELFKRQGDFIAAQLPSYAWFGADRSGGREDEHMGIFYRRDRIRLLKKGDFWLSYTPQVAGSRMGNHPYPRMVTWGLMKRAKSGKLFYIFNTHFAHRSEDEGARLLSAQMLRRAIDSLPARVPVIVTGDFNTGPGGAVHDALGEAVTDVRLDALSKEGPEGTFHAFTGKATRRIDWILVRGFRPVATKTVTTSQGPVFPSDHFPVVADLEIRVGH